MTLALGSIADDYTGASDFANTLTRCGLRTFQTISVPAADLALPGVDAVVVALKSRSIAARQAVELARAADDWLRTRGAGHVMFKICSTFDSTDAGNIGPVADALRAAAGSRIVLVTPAFPETARTVYQGNLFVGSVPLNERSSRCSRRGGRCSLSAMSGRTPNKRASHRNVSPSFRMRRGQGQLRTRFQDLAGP
jgi:3-dehydrotetronate 4-kinase